MSSAAPVLLKFEKQHTCVACGCVFRYGLEKTPAGLAGFQAIASGAGDGSYQRQAECLVETHPCPSCGLIQPDMVMWSKLAHLAMTFVALVALLGLGVASSAMGLSLHTLAQVGIGIFLTIAVVHLGTAFTNPNRDRQGNLALARQEVAEGKLKLVAPGREEDKARPQANLSSWHYPGLMLVAVAPVAFFYPLLFLGDEVPQPTNAELEPALVTPGTAVTYKVTGLTAKAIGNVWRGRPTLTVLNAAEVGLPPTLSAEGSDREWDHTLWVPRGSNNETLVPTVQFTLPRNDSLAGKTVRLRLWMPVKYAYSNGNGPSGRSFLNGTLNVSRILTVRVADPRLRNERMATFAVGLAGGLASVLGGLWLGILAAQLQKRALPAEVVLPGGELFEQALQRWNSV